MNETRPRLILAVNPYDRHVPLVDGTVQPDGITLQMLIVGQSVPGPYGAHRHSRMLQGGEFDYAVLPLSSYLMARDRGAPFIAIPVFLRRLFSLSQICVRVGTGIASPVDLVGRRVGLGTYQTTLSVLAKGDLAHFYGVSWKQIRWVTDSDEEVRFAVPPDVSLERAPAGHDLSALLVEGTLDALMRPHPPRAFLEGDPRVGRLFTAPAPGRSATRGSGATSRSCTWWRRAELGERYPWSAPVMYAAFEAARRATAAYWDDPNWSILAWGRQALEEQLALFGRDPWTNGVAANRTNLEQFVQYSFEQGLISRPRHVEELFHASTLDT